MEDVKGGECIQGREQLGDAPKKLESILAELADLRGKGTISPEEYTELAREAAQQYSEPPGPADDGLAANSAPPTARTTCRYCGEETTTGSVRCQHCDSDLVAPATKESTPQRPEKPCPLCGEQILAVAVKCKHCGSDLPGLKQVQQEEAWFSGQAASSGVGHHQAAPATATGGGEAIGILGLLLAIGCFFGPWISCDGKSAASGYDLTELYGLLWISPLALFAAVGVVSATGQIGGARRVGAIVGILTGVANAVILIVILQIWHRMSQFGGGEKAVKALVESTRWGFWGTLVGTTMADVGVWMAAAAERRRVQKPQRAPTGDEGFCRQCLQRGQSVILQLHELRCPNCGGARSVGSGPVDTITPCKVCSRKGLTICLRPSVLRCPRCGGTRRL